MTTPSADAEFLRDKLQILLDRDLEIPEFHAMQMPLAQAMIQLLTENEQLRGRLGLIAPAAIRGVESVQTIAELQSDLAASQERERAANDLATRSTRRLVELSEPGSIGAFAARDAALLSLARSELALTLAQERAERARQELQILVLAKRFDRTVFDDDTSFADWAQSRCRAAIAATKEAGK